MELGIRHWALGRVFTLWGEGIWEFHAIFLTHTKEAESLTVGGFRDFTPVTIPAGRQNGEKPSE